jgi:hypothetical protein
MSPTRATGLIYEAQWDGRPAIRGVLGTCFAFRHSTHLLTTAHCVGGRGIEAIGIVIPTKFDRLRNASEVVRHPDADLALIRLEDVEDDAGCHAFWDSVGNYAAEDFVAFGYPIDTFGTQQQPTPRLFKGHFQRFIDPFRPEGSSYSYLAGEMSIPAPVGMSGGPIFRPGAPPMLLGMVTANLSSSTAAGEESYEEVESDGSIRRTVYRHVVSYGVALILDSVKDWLDEHVPPREHD